MIRFHRATKRFNTAVAVDALTLAVRPSEVVALLGPNGSGKTTTLKMAAGLIRPDAGEVMLGEPPRAAWDPAARISLSFLPQRVAFAETLTGGEVVEFYRRLRGVAPERAAAVLRFASLNGAGDRAVGTYSGGMVQRLGLAVAMLPEVPALLLDEPTAALDPEGLQAFYALVDQRRSAGRSTLFTSHQVTDVERLADRVVVMVKGRLAGEYTREALRAWRDTHGVMRVRLDSAAARVLGAVQPLAPQASASGNELSVQGPASGRPAILDIIRASGAAIVGLTAEDARVDALYADLVAGCGEHSDSA